MAYGEPLFVALMAETFNYALIEPRFDWLPNLPSKYRCRNIELTTLEEARKREGELFAKPADDKCFAASVYKNGSSIKASELLPGNIPVLISDVVKWTLEYRFFILERTVATGSLYAVNGELATDKGSSEMHAKASRFVEDILADTELKLPPAAVLDVGLLDNSKWAVIESNPAFGSGIYFCDPTKVLPVLARSFVPSNKLTATDRSWVLKRVL